jgi:hypothetical protein
MMRCHVFDIVALTAISASIGRQSHFPSRAAAQINRAIYRLALLVIIPANLPLEIYSAPGHP